MGNSLCADKDKPQIREFRAKQVPPRVTRVTCNVSRVAGRVPVLRGPRAPGAVRAGGGEGGHLPPGRGQLPLMVGRVSCFMCHVSYHVSRVMCHITCHVSCSMCHVSCAVSGG